MFVCMNNLYTKSHVPRFSYGLLFMLQVSTLMNGHDVKLNLLLHSGDAVTRQLSIKISAQAMKYTGKPAATIQKETKEETLQADKGKLIHE